MITRPLFPSEVVHAFDPVTFHSCTVTGFTCTCGVGSTGGALPFSYHGRMIDRYALSKNFQSVKIAPTANGAIQSSDASTIKYLGLAVGLQHSATTCAADFADYSTGDWPSEQALQVVTTATSTGAPLYTDAGRAVAIPVAGQLSTAATTSTSTGYAALASFGIGAIPLTACKRYIKVVVAPHIETTGCGGSNMTVGASLIFGDPVSAPATAAVGRAFVTSGCST